MLIEVSDGLPMLLRVKVRWYVWQQYRFLEDFRWQVLRLGDERCTSAYQGCKAKRGLLHRWGERFLHYQFILDWMAISFFTVLLAPEGISIPYTLLGHGSQDWPSRSLPFYLSKGNPQTTELVLGIRCQMMQVTSRWHAGILRLTSHTTLPMICMGFALALAYLIAFIQSDYNNSITPNLFFRPGSAVSQVRNLSRQISCCLQS